MRLRCRHYLAKQMLRGSQDMLNFSSQLPSLQQAAQVPLPTAADVSISESCCCCCYGCCCCCCCCCCGCCRRRCRLQVRLSWLVSEMESASQMLERVSVRALLAAAACCCCLRWPYCSSAFEQSLVAGGQAQGNEVHVAPTPCCRPFTCIAVVCRVDGRVPRGCCPSAVGPQAQHTQHKARHGGCRRLRIDVT